MEHDTVVEKARIFTALDVIWAQTLGVTMDDPEARDTVSHAIDSILVALRHMEVAND